MIPKSQRDFCAKEKVKIKKILLRATKLLVKGRKKKKGGKMSFFCLLQRMYDAKIHLNSTNLRVKCTFRFHLSKTS
jgi:hypothetical protein